MRIVKPEFWSSEQVVECSPTARLLFVGLWCFCDDGGVHPSSAARLKMEVFPADPFTTEQVIGWVEELHKAGLLETYRVDGKDFWRVTGWHHQKIEKPTYTYPLSAKFGEQSSNRRRGLADQSTPERNGDERNGGKTNGVERSFIDDRKTIGSSDAKSGVSDSPANGRSSHSSRSSKEPGNGKAVEAFDLSSLDWERVTALAETAARKVPPRSQQDRRAWLRYAAIAVQFFTEEWIVESAQAAAMQDTKRSKQAHFVGVLKTKASEQHGIDEAAFASMVRRVEIPTSVWKSSILEIDNAK